LNRSWPSVLNCTVQTIYDRAMKSSRSAAGGARVRPLDAALREALQRVKALKKNAREVKSQLKEAKKAVKRAAKAVRRAKKAETPTDDAAAGQPAARRARARKPAKSVKAKAARKTAAATKPATAKKPKAATRATTVKKAKPSKTASPKARTSPAAARRRPAAPAPAPKEAPAYELESALAGGEAEWNQDDWTADLPAKSE
jgi:histone H1/5